MPEHNPEQMGGTMRLGKRTVFEKESVLSKWRILCFFVCHLGKEMNFITDGQRMEFMELQGVLVGSLAVSSYTKG